MNKVISNHPVISFFILTLSWSSCIWIWQIPQFNLNLPENLFWLGESAPGFSALFLTWFLYGKSGIVNLIKQTLRFKANPIYYFIVFVALAYFYLAAIGLSALLGAHPPEFLELYSQIKTPILNLSAIWLIPELTILYMFCEELGWRGFALPHLMKKFNAFNSSIIIGVVWAIFHIPLMLGNIDHITFIYLIGYVFATVLSSFLFTWIYLKTNASLLIVGFLHALIDIYGAFSPTIISDIGQGKNYSTIFLYFIILLPLIVNLNQGKNWVRNNAI
jgi:membrane protease YdiL (CAAX protease family)